MNKEGRKMGMFSTSVSFGTQGMSWSPTEEDIQNQLTSVLEDMI